MKLAWRNSLSGDYSLHSDYHQVGTLRKGGLLSQTFFGELNGKNLVFVRKSLMDQTILISNPNNEQVGYITFETWNNRASIFFRNTNFVWKYDHFMQSSWTVEKNSKIMVHFKKGFKTGTIDYGDEGIEELILAALLVYKRRQSALYIALFVIFMPIFIRLLSNN